MQPKFIILDSIHKGLYFPLALIFIAALAVWIINLMLGFTLGNSKVKIPQLLLYGSLMAAYMFTRPFMDDSVFMVTFYLFFILILIFVGKITLFNSVAIAIVNGFLSALSTSIVGEPLLCIHNVKAFLLGSPYGVAVGTLSEIIFSLIVLIFAKKINFIDFFIKDKYTRNEVAYLAVFVLLFLTLYYTTMDLIFFFTESNKIVKNFISHRLFMGWLLVGATIIVMIWARASNLKRGKILNEFLDELDLTNAKKEVLRLKLDGKKLEEIAQIRGVALTTVKTQINEIKKELNIKDFKEVLDRIKK